MSVNAISMRRMILGEGSLVESLMGRVLVLVLFTSLVGSVLTLLFLVNHQWLPALLKYAILAATGIAAGFGARRLLMGRNLFIRLGAAIFSLIISMGLLNVLSLGYVGLNLLRAYPSDPPWDGALQLVLASSFSWLTLRAWAGTVREIVVEPRYTQIPAPAPASRSTRRPASHPARRSTGRPSSARGPRRAAARSTSMSFGAAFSTWSARVATQLSGIFPAPSRGTTARRRKTKKKPAKAKSRGQRLLRRQRAVYLSGDVEHRCPYCLEQVRPNDPRGVKICKVCKTWHHGDCWAITGVCQVPHQFVN